MPQFFSPKDQDLNFKSCNYPLKITAVQIFNILRSKLFGPPWTIFFFVITHKHSGWGNGVGWRPNPHSLTYHPSSLTRDVKVGRPDPFLKMGCKNTAGRAGGLVGRQVKSRLARLNH